jgi:rare lipoprotein A
MTAQNAREIGAFSDSRRYGRASPRVVSHDQSVPKGGGRDHVGRPYRINGRWYTPRENPDYSAVGMSSWYGDAFHGRKTANGEVYDKHAYTAAHPTMPLPSYARVTNTSNGRSIVVRVNDRGPYHGGRIIDVSERVAHALDFKSRGTARVQVDYLRRASVAGSDDRMLLASLRTDGGGADLPGGAGRAPERPSIMLASNTQPAPVAQPVIAQPVAAAPSSRSAVQAQLAAVSSPQPVARSVPLPQDRPFDLDAIPGGDRAIGRVENGQGTRQRQIRPPQPAPAEADREPGTQIDARGSQGQRTAALYFANPTGFGANFVKDDPMRRLKPAFQPVEHQRIGGQADSGLSLQAGVFRDKANADRIAKLLSAHAKANIRETGTGDQRRFIVSAAGFADRSQAEKAKAALSSAGVRDARLISR